MTDPVTGVREPVRERLERVLGTAPPEPAGGAAHQRAVAAERGLPGLVDALADDFVVPGLGSALS
jgi:hypothetical protein